MSIQETTNEVNTFSNENLNILVTKLPQCKIKLDITVEPQAVQAAYTRAIKNIKKEVVVPGFRKGKAPDTFILEQYSKSIDKEWKEVVLQTAFHEAIQLTSAFPLQNGYMANPVVHEISKENGAKFSIQYETRPLIPAIDPNTIVLKKSKVEPLSEQDLRNGLYNVQLQFTDYEEVIGRPIQEGDFVNLDIDLLHGENVQRIIENKRIQVGSEGFPKWIEEKIIGLNAGETAEGNTEPEPTKEDPDFQSVPFRATVRSIWQGQMPEVNDELASKAGVPTVEELKQKIQEALQKEIERETEESDLHELVQFLVKNYPIELPQSMIDRNVELRLNDYISKISDQNKEISNKEKSQIKQSIYEQTIPQLQLAFLLRKLADDNQIEVTQNDISNELSRQVSQLSSGRSHLDLSNKETFREQLEDLALDHKIKRFLLEKATFVNE